MKWQTRGLVLALLISIGLSAGSLILSAIALKRVSQPTVSALTAEDVQFLVEQTIQSRFAESPPQVSLPLDSPALEITNQEADADLLHDKDVAHRFASLSPWDQKGLNRLLLKFRQDATQVSNRELLAIRPFVSRDEQRSIDDTLVERSKKALGKP